MNAFESFKTLDLELTNSIEDDPIAALSAITELRRAIAVREREGVFRALEDHSWREVGEALGVSKQAAFQRFGPEWLTATQAQQPKDWKRTVKARLG